MPCPAPRHKARKTRPTHTSPVYDDRSTVSARPKVARCRAVCLLVGVQEAPTTKVIMCLFGAVRTHNDTRVQGKQNTRSVLDWTTLTSRDEWCQFREIFALRQYKVSWSGDKSYVRIKVVRLKANIYIQYLDNACHNKYWYRCSVFYDM